MNMNMNRQRVIVPDFILAAGDDVTDEDLLARLPKSAWTIHVGRNQSRARCYLPKPDDMLALLAQLSHPGPPQSFERLPQKWLMAELD